MVAAFGDAELVHALALPATNASWAEKCDGVY
jgi:hypothetical protein